MTNNPFPLDHDQLVASYRTMKTIREFEERLHVDFARGDIPGFVHLYAGEEAIATGIIAHLNDRDRFASTHRGHGHCIAKGVDVHEMMAEIHGKATGSCRGKGGSMHIADLSKGMMGANGILGAGAPLVCGAALASKRRGDGGVGITVFGDGAANQGTILESMNLAAAWKLPVIFVCENNGYAEATSVKHVTGSATYLERFNGFGISGALVDGSDFFAVYETAGELIRRAREGEGPFFLECKVNRFFGHFEGDAQTYRTKAELEDVRANHDCLKIFKSRVTEVGVVRDDEFIAVDKEVMDLIESSVQAAMAAPLPSPDDLLKDVYVSY